jgi:hypothetical protein
MPDLDAEAKVMLAHPVPVQEAMQMLRFLVRETLPEAEERPHAGWARSTTASTASSATSAPRATM